MPEVDFLTPRADFETLLIEEGPRPFNYAYAGPLGKFLQEIEDRDRATTEGVSPFWLTFCTDHIYENCPGARRGKAWKGDSKLYPERYVGKYAGDLCGWCARVWRSKHPGSKAGIWLPSQENAPEGGPDGAH